MRAKRTVRARHAVVPNLSDVLLNHNSLLSHAIDPLLSDESSVSERRTRRDIERY